MPYQHVQVSTCAIGHCKGSCMLVEGCHRLATLTIAYLIADSGGAFLTYSSQIASRCWQSIDIDVTNADSQCDLPYCMIMRASNVLVAKTLQLNMFACTCTMEHASVEFFYSLVTLVRQAVTLLVVRGCAS